MDLVPWDLLSQYLKLPVFALVAGRLGGILMFQPVLASLAVPVLVRALLVLGLAALLTPLVPLPADAPDTLLGMTLAIGGEVLIGGLIGLVSVGLFLGFQLGALMIAQESGLAFGQIVDPTSEEDETVLGVFYVQLAVVVYLLIGGHRALVAVSLDTFQSIPLLSLPESAAPGVELVVRALTVGGQVALRLAAPTMIALFLVNLVLGFVSRTMPQLNVLAVGFSVKALIAFVLMAVSLPTLADTFLMAVAQMGDWLHELLLV